VPEDTNSTPDVFVHDRQTGTTERVSVDSAGNQWNTYFYYPSLSADGRFVAFTSRSTNLVPGDTNGSPDVFVHDRRTGTTERVSVDSAGIEGNFQSYGPALSADGRFVAFKSSATNLVPGDNNRADDVFVRDRQTGITERVSVASDSMQGNREAWFLGPPALSADGRFLAFISEASNLVPGDTNGTPDVFVHDRQTGATQRVSVDSAGNQWNTYFYYPALSADGRVVAFSRFRPLTYTMGSRQDVYVHDRQTGTTELVGMNSAGGATLSADGRFVFGTWANADFGVTPAPFVYDRQTGTAERVNVDGHPSAISLDFRFVAFTSYCGTIYGSECAPVPGDTNSASDVFVHNRQTGITELVGVASDGTQGDSGSYSPAISADGRIVAFISDATNLVLGDTNGLNDVFVHDRGAPSRVTTTVSFDSPAPPGGAGPLDGVFQGIDFGTGQWVWEGPYNVDSTNNVYFASSTGTSRIFAFSPAPRVLNSMSVFSPEPGTLTLSDDAGQTLSQDVATGSMRLVTTGWSRPSTTVTVSFTMRGSLGVDDITYAAAP